MKMEDVRRWWQLRVLRARVKRAVAAVRFINGYMEICGVSREKRKTFWKEFAKDGEVRMNTLEMVLEDAAKLR